MSAHSSSRICPFRVLLAFSYLVTICLVTAFLSADLSPTEVPFPCHGPGEGRPVLEDIVR